MPKKEIDERRQWTRAKRIMSIQFRSVEKGKEPDDNSWKLSTTQDMSVGGLSFYTDKELHIGDTIQLLVVMSGVLEIYNGFAKVVHVHRKKTGSHFLIGIELIQKPLKKRSAKSFTTKKKAAKRV